MSPPPVPILVVGANRSGTTWLSNLLCNHDQVAGVQSSKHFGILETNMFGKMQKVFGDLENDLNWCAFVCTWSNTDFFKYTGLPREFLTKELSTNRSYVGIFCAVMNQFATRQRTDYWLEKIRPTELRYVAEILPGSKIIVIQRNLFPKLASKFQLLTNHGLQFSTIRSAAEYVLQNKCASTLKNRDNAIFVSYEDLVKDTATELNKICDFIGIPSQPEIVENRFERNSSYSTGNQNSNRTPITLSLNQKLTISIIFILANCLPRFLLLWMFETFRKPDPKFITGTFSDFESNLA